MKLLVTGAAGFLGKHLLRELADKTEGPSFVALDLKHALSRIPPGPACEAIACDLSDGAAASAALSGRNFDAVVHLAALLGSHHRDVLFKTNVEGTRNLLTALDRTRHVKRVILLSSAAVYGAPLLADLPLIEDAPLRPVSPYGESFVAREEVAKMWTTRTRVELCVLRPFNLIGPGQAPTMMIPAVARQIARIELGLQAPVLQVGRLDTKRDFVDVRDAARAIAMALSAERLHTGGEDATLNLASGRGHEGRDIVAQLLLFTSARVEVEQSIQPARASDAPVVYGDSSRIERVLDWRPRLTFKESLRDVLNSWRQELRPPS
jgi:GDP-4-dehydro-6-deoxy-D-mannose reductase